MDTGTLIREVISRWYPELFELKAVTTLLGNDARLEALAAGKPLAEPRGMWQEKLVEFRVRRENARFTVRMKLECNVGEVSPYRMV